MGELSGKDWWQKNQARYPNSRDLTDLESDFQQSVQRFIKVLRDGGAAVNIASTLRNPLRAHLMHYSWRVAHEEIEPDKVPPKSGLDIVWDHGNKDASIAAAAEMVDLFNIAYRPAISSNHVRGRAIDMNVSWKGNLIVGPLPDGSFRGVNGPRSGAKNAELHEIGELFAVIKLKKDPPHWSVDGK